MAAEHFDVLIVGAGLSGIGAGVHLQRRCPDRSTAILEGRDALYGQADVTLDTSRQSAEKSLAALRKAIAGEPR